MYRFPFCLTCSPKEEEQLIHAFAWKSIGFLEALMQMVFLPQSTLSQPLCTSSLEVMWHWINDYSYPTLPTHCPTPGSEKKRLCVNTGREIVFYVQWLAFLDLIMSLGITALLFSSSLKTLLPLLLFPPPHTHPHPTPGSFCPSLR